MSFLMKMRRLFKENAMPMWKRYKLLVVGVAFLLFVVLLTILNWDGITNPPDISLGYKQIIREVVLTKTNLHVMAFGAVYLIATALYFLIRLPFLNIEQLKVPGLEYKLQAEAQAKVAEVDMKAVRNFESSRLAFIQTFKEPKIVEGFYQLLEADSFNIFEGAKLLADTMKEFFAENMSVKISAEVLLVKKDGTYDLKQYRQLPFILRGLIQEVLQGGKSQYDKTISRSAIAVPLSIEDPEYYCILYAQSKLSEIVLGEADCIMIEISWMNIGDRVNLFYVQEELAKLPG